MLLTPEIILLKTPGLVFRQLDAVGFKSMFYAEPVQFLHGVFLKKSLVGPFVIGLIIDLKHLVIGDLESVPKSLLAAPDKGHLLTVKGVIHVK